MGGCNDNCRLLRNWRADRLDAIGRGTAASQVTMDLVSTDPPNDDSRNAFMGHSYDRAGDWVYHSLLLLGSHSCHWRQRLNRILVPSCSAKVRREEMDSVLYDSLLIFGGFVILLAPLTLALADTGPGKIFTKIAHTAF